MSGSMHSLDTSDSLSDSSLDLDEEALLAQQEWEESIEQLQTLLSFVLLPMAGKYLGRTFSHWGESLLTYGTGRGLLTIFFYPNSLCQIPTHGTGESLLARKWSGVAYHSHQPLYYRFLHILLINPDRGPLGSYPRLAISSTK